MRVKSLYSCIENFFIFPKSIRFNNHKLQHPPKTIPKEQKKEAQVFVNKQPAIIKNSPIKLLVPGNPILAKVKRVKKVEKSGVVVSNPA